MCECKVDQHLMVLNLYSISISKILVMGCIIAKARTVGTFFQMCLNFLKNQTLRWLQNIKKQFDYKKSCHTKQINRVKNIRIKVYKWNEFKCLIN